MSKSKYALVTSAILQRELDETAATLPIYARLPDLFRDEQMFESYDRFADEGFELIDHAEHKIMSGSHDRAPGYLFKKYDDDRSAEEQLLNYMFRIEGSRLLRSFIAEHGFTRVVAPRKWLYELAPGFPTRHLVVAQRLDLLSKRETERSYDRIDRDQVRELATILYYFRGLNSTAANLPFTEDGKIAFIDTERWHHDKDYLRKVGDRLPPDRRRLAEDVYDDLEYRGATPHRSAFKKSRRRDREARGEQTNAVEWEVEREGDFEREEDTSSSSSSASSS